VGLTAGLYDAEKRIILILSGTNSDISLVQTVALRCTENANPAPIDTCVYNI
jgi:hypothetical protein